MLLTNIKLKNIGIYKGSNEFPLTTTFDKPLVLYGGINGAGKTTLFESILLCLYGQNFTESKMTKKQYHKKIHRLFHHNAKTRSSSRDASAMLEFQYAQNGEIHEYRITRIWQNNDGEIDEFLTISTKRANSKKYSQIKYEISHLQHMINQMIPKAIADLFFFDGEKIQDLAKSGNENMYIKTSFDNLLGLDTAERLHDDLGLYLLRNSDGAESGMLKDLERANHDKSVAQNNLERIKEKRVFLNGEISQLDRKLQLKEEEFFKLGGTFAQNRQKLITEKTDLSKHIAQNELILRDLIEKDLPLAIVTDHLKQINNDLQYDITTLKEMFEKDTLSGAFDYIIEVLEPFLNSYTPKIKKELLEHLDQISEDKLKSLSDKKQTIFDFSLSDMKILQEKIKIIRNKNYSAIYENKNKHHHFLQKQKEISAKLNVTPQQDEIGPLYSEIKGVAMEMGEMDQDLQNLTQMESQAKSRIVLLNSKIRKYLSERKTDQRKFRGMDMIPSIQKALNDYSKILRLKKIQTLESNIFEGIQRCFHKDGLVANVSIDPQSYKVILSRDNGDEISRENLSKGELQMYATAIVWGLAKTSERSLPFIIDTPLARLDEQHRENLVENFYPNASHQIIIFSTDTEIVDSYYELLKPYISQVGLIIYDADHDCSMLDKTYFEKRGSLIAV